MSSTSAGTRWSDADQEVLMSLHRVVRQHDEAEFSTCSSWSDAVHAYNIQNQQAGEVAFSLMYFPSSSNSRPTEATPPISSSCQPRLVTHAQITTVLTDLCHHPADSGGFVWIDLIDLSSLPSLACHYDIHDACLRGK